MSRSDSLANSYRMCSRCVMDTSAFDIAFDSDGQCNYCTELTNRLASESLESALSQSSLETLINDIKASSRRKDYDCIVGVSGGVDSSWALVKAVELGLRPLAVHMDNGWDSELAQNNISNLITRLGVDLVTHVIDWDEYRGLMQSFFEADVVDVELLYDNAMVATNYNIARRYSLHHILSGANAATEGMRIPTEWNWYKLDKRNIKSISKYHGGPRLKTFPAIGTLQKFRYQFVNRIKWIRFLDLFPYNKEEALATLEKEFAFRRYPYKHYESIFTRFYQGFLLPNKFQVDKRRMHLSSLVISSQMSRAEAIDNLGHATYPNANDLQSDLEFFLRKMRWTQSDLDDYLARPRREHTDFRSERRLAMRISQLKAALLVG